MASLAEYEKLLAPARNRFAESAGFGAMQSMTDEVLCELFLMYFCALGVEMTKPVEDWIRRAGARCSSMGFSELGRALDAHASAEADHHLLMIDDLRSLASRWNRRHFPPIDADGLLDRLQSPGVTKYRQIHEETIAGRTPFAQFAIEYEIEMLPVRFGNIFVERCMETLGIDILSCLSFMTKHIALDAAHTKFNAKALAAVIAQAPESMPALVSAGSLALDAYAEFLDDCVKLARCHAQRTQITFDARPSPWDWRLKRPGYAAEGEDEFNPADWLHDVASLRGKVLYENGRRPAFRRADGHFLDVDPIDAHAHHILTYHGTRLVGCVRVYRLSPYGPPSVAERVLGESKFSKMLQKLDAQRDEIVEIGRWIVDPDYRTTNFHLNISLQLAAASGAVARAMGRSTPHQRGFVICAAGTEDRQDAILKRIGLTPVPGVDSIDCPDYRDRLSILCCSQSQKLSPTFARLMDQMDNNMKLPERLLEANEFA
jgi:hypothetical protein